MLFRSLRIGTRWLDVVMRVQEDGRFARRRPEIADHRGMSPFGAQHARVGTDRAQHLGNKLGRLHEWRGIVAQCADRRDAHESLEVSAYLRHQVTHTRAQVGGRHSRHCVIIDQTGSPTGNGQARTPCRARGWLRRPAFNESRSVRAGWAQMLARRGACLPVASRDSRESGLFH